MQDKASTLFNRRQVLAGSTAAGAAALVVAKGPAGAAKSADNLTRAAGSKPVKVAFLIDEGATIIDFCGPWEVFQDVSIGKQSGFELFTVAPTTRPITASGGMKIVPDYALEDAPQANVIVIPAQAGGRDPKAGGAKPEWLKSRHPETDLIMSVCTGAFLLAKSGLLDGLEATTHHYFYDSFEEMFPKVRLVRNRRYVENGSIMSAGGLTSGIDGALRVVERYYGRSSATATTEYMEYQSKGWIQA